MSIRSSFVEGNSSLEKTTRSKKVRDAKTPNRCSGQSSIGSHRARAQSAVSDGARARNRTARVHGSIAMSIRKSPARPAR